MRQPEDIIDRKGEKVSSLIEPGLFYLRDGLGDFFKLDAAFFRAAFAVAALAGGAGVLFYIVLWLLVPRTMAGPEAVY